MVFQSSHISESVYSTCKDHTHPETPEARWNIGCACPRPLKSQTPRSYKTPSLWVYMFSIYAILEYQNRKVLDTMWLRFMELTLEFGVETPKTHLMCHVSDRARSHGNPWLYTTFYDESLNKELKKVLRLVHQANFEAIGLQKVVSVFLAQSQEGSP